MQRHYSDTAPHGSVVVAFMRRQHNVTNEMVLYNLIYSHTGGTIIRKIMQHRTI